MATPPVDRILLMSNGYGKRPLWQWILLYIVIGGVIYAVAYYFFFANNGASGAYSYNTPTSTATTQNGSQNTGTSTTNQSAPTSAQSMSVTISNMAFNPAEISVKAGTTVTWTNNDSIAHTVTSDTGVFDSKALNPGQSYSFVFATPGTFTYHCSIHPSMKAGVVVTQ
jgi:amicyanin